MTQLRRGMGIDLDLNPTKGSETGKIRPCIVVTNDTYNAKVPVISSNSGCTRDRMEREESQNFDKR